jgi:hypothetical protein
MNKSSCSGIGAIYNDTSKKIPKIIHMLLLIEYSVEALVAGSRKFEDLLVLLRGEIVIKEIDRIEGF